MAFYSVHNREGLPADRAIFVREGFSIGAFVFTALWALWHRMWLVAGILIFFSGILALTGEVFGLGKGLLAVAGFAVNLIFGFEARDLQIRALIARGFKQVGLSHGKNLDEAEIRFFHREDRRPPLEAVLLRPLPNAGSPDTLGIFGNV